MRSLQFKLRASDNPVAVWDVLLAPSRLVHLHPNATRWGTGKDFVEVTTSWF